MDVEPAIEPAVGQDHFLQDVLEHLLVLQDRVERYLEAQKDPDLGVDDSVGPMVDVSDMLVNVSRGIARAMAFNDGYRQGWASGKAVSEANHHLVPDHFAGNPTGGLGFIQAQVDRDQGRRPRL